MKIASKRKFGKMKLKLPTRGGNFDPLTYGWVNLGYFITGQMGLIEGNLLKGNWS